MQAKLAHAQSEVRFACEPFPLFPGEIITTPVTPLTVVEANCALRLRATLDFVDGKQPHPLCPRTTTLLPTLPLPCTAPTLPG